MQLEIYRTVSFIFVVIALVAICYLDAILRAILKKPKRKINYSEVAKVALVAGIALLIGSWIHAILIMY